MKSFALDISGIDKVESLLKSTNQKLTKVLSQVMDDSALAIELDAKEKVPVNFGYLKGSIKKDITADLFKSVYTNVYYAPYVEFGTSGTKKSQVKIPPGFETFAAQFKGQKRKAVVGFYEAIQHWVKRKGIDEKLTYSIFLSILQKGIKPQPYLIPAYQTEKPKLIKRLLNLFK